MFATFFHELKAAKVPVTLKEYLTLMEALQADLADRNVEHFYYLSRAALVKDERHLDKFDQVFGHVFKGLELMTEAVEKQIPEEWLRSLAQLYLTDEEKAKIEALGGWDKIMEELKKRLEEQKGRHQGGKKWIGTGGIALTDDLLGQFLGQDLLRRLSRRLGEGAFNGALTARVGIAAIDVIRPLPFLVTKPPRVRDVLGEALRPMFGAGKA